MSEPLAISVTEAARLLNVSRPTLYNLLHTEGFPAFHCGGRTLISRAGLEEWIQKQVEAANDEN